MGDVLKVAACGLAFAIPAIAASTVTVNVDEEHQVIRGFGGMVHNTWQSGGGLSDADAKIAFGTGEGTIGLNTLRIPVNKNSNDFGKEVQAAKSAKKIRRRRLYPLRNSVGFPVCRRQPAYKF